MRAREPALAASIACCVLPLAYATLGLVQHFMFPSPDPRLVMNVEHIAFYWRLLLSSYVAVLSFVGALAAARRWPARVDALLPTLLAVTAALVVAQGVVWP